MSLPRLLFDEPKQPRRPYNHRKWQYTGKNDETSAYTKEMYELHEYICDNVDLPENIKPPIIIKDVGEKPGKAYRVTIYENMEGGTSKLGKYGPGTYVWKSYYVEVTPDGYVFTPPIREV